MRSLRVEPGTVARHASDLAGHRQRCRGGFYRGNCDGGGSSSESTGIDNSTNGDAGTDADNQNSDDAASDDDARPEEQSKYESQAEDNDAMDVNAVASAEEAAESEETTTAITNITNADDLSAKLQGVGKTKLPASSLQLILTMLVKSNLRIAAAI